MNFKTILTLKQSFVVDLTCGSIHKLVDQLKEDIAMIGRKWINGAIFFISNNEILKYYLFYFLKNKFLRGKYIWSIILYQKQSLT
ncbi:MAG: hypothetical protein HQK51_05540 [Oligoflexia bacterium]|nr:hypothetical protein [Oligoflexia bacterium]